MEISSAQIREARALARLSAQKLADAAGVSLATVQRFEVGKGKTVPAIRAAIIRALEDYGIEFGDGEVFMRDRTASQNYRNWLR